MCVFSSVLLKTFRKLRWKKTEIYSNVNKWNVAHLFSIFYLYFSELLRSFTGSYVGVQRHKIFGLRSRATNLGHSGNLFRVKIVPNSVTSINRLNMSLYKISNSIFRQLKSHQIDSNQLIVGNFFSTRNQICKQVFKSTDGKFQYSLKLFKANGVK